MSMTLSRTDPKSGAAGPLDALNQDPFGVDFYSYPSDINKLAHAMIFNINVPVNSLNKKVDPNGPVPSSIDVTTRQDGKGSRSQQLREGTLLGMGVELAGVNITTQRKTKRITKTISLYVPETMVFDSQQSYDTPELGSMAAQIIGASLVGGAGAFVLRRFGALGSLVGAGLGAVASTGAGGTAQTIASEASGYSVNPVIEVLYKNPELRQFQFDFNFAPRSRDEATAIFNIIQTFRAYQAPEFLSTGQGLSGALFIPPAEWDITFVRQDESGSFVQNSNIPGISTCVLRTMNVNYAPEGQWVTHTDGFPTHIQMRLEFLEIDIITRERIEQGF